MSAGAAKFYDQYHTHFKIQEETDPVMIKTREVYKSFLRGLNPTPGASLLDLSCGQGMFLQSAQAWDPSLQIWGMDLSKKAVANARVRAPWANLKSGDALKTGYKSKSFDFVTCLGALEHYPDPVKGTREICRILKDDGRAYVYVPNLFFLGYIFLVWKTGEEPHEAGQNQFEWFHTLRGWEEIFEAEGLKVVGIEKFNDMYATERVPQWMITAYNLFIQPFIPMNLSYCWGFVLEKKLG